jgi:hypothetical protein
MKPQTRKVVATANKEVDAVNSSASAAVKAADARYNFNLDYFPHVEPSLDASSLRSNVIRSMKILSLFHSSNRVGWRVYNSFSASVEAAAKITTPMLHYCHFV